MATFTVVVPAFNEHRLIAQCLLSIKDAAELLQHSSGQRTQIIVVDDGSTDGTGPAAAATGLADTIVFSGGRVGVSAARNLGAHHAEGQYLVFFDADVRVSRYCLLALEHAIATRSLVAGGLTALYRPRKLGSWLVCAFWDWRRMTSGLAQGVGQFYERDLFFALGGYDPSLVMSEDFDLMQRARRAAKQAGQAVGIVAEAIVWPSTRRYDAWSTPRMILWQNPWTTRLRRSDRRFWKYWQSEAIR